MINKIILLVWVSFFTVFTAYSSISISNVTHNSCNISISDSSENGYIVIIKTLQDESFKYKSLDAVNNVDNVVDYNLINNFSSSSKIISKYKFPSKFSLINLEPQTDYFIDVIFSNDKVISKPFNTFAIEPSIQASEIIFKSTSEDEITFAAKPGNGEGTLIVVRQGQMPENPFDGTEYISDSTFGNPKSKYGNGNYVIYKDKFNRRNEFMLSGLAFDNYFIKMFEYNGKGKYINYNSNDASNNPRNKFTKLMPPELKQVEFVGDNILKLKWTEVKNADTYLIDVAYNDKFTNLLEFFNNADIGNLNEFEFALPGNFKSDKVYIRLRAKGANSVSANSKVFEVSILKN